MLFEHLIYSTAIAIIAGMLWYKRTGRDPSWIIIASAFVPDFDIVVGGGAEVGYRGNLAHNFLHMTLIKKTTLIGS